MTIEKHWVEGGGEDENARVLAKFVTTLWRKITLGQC